MKQLYRVRWKSLRTGAGGVSDGAWPKEKAQAWADELNSRPENRQSVYSVEPTEKQANKKHPLGNREELGVVP